MPSIPATSSAVSKRSTGSGLSSDLAAREHAKPLPHPRLGHLWHLCAKPVYAAIDQAYNRHRRPAEWATAVRKLMTLDFGLAHQEAQFYAAEADKVALLRDSHAIPETCWPATLYAAKGLAGAVTVRYFVDKMPWFREASDAGLWLSYVDDGETLAGFETFLTQYRSLLGSMRSGLVHVSRGYDARVAAMFRRVVLGAKEPQH